jgi:hypothetical protein
MIARLTAVTAAAISVVLLAPAVLLGNTASSLSIVVLGAVVLVGGMALTRNESRTAWRAGAIVAVVGAVVLVFGVGLVALLYLGAFSGY